MPEQNRLTIVIVQFAIEAYVVDRLFSICKDNHFLPSSRPQEYGNKKSDHLSNRFHSPNKY